MVESKLDLNYINSNRGLLFKLRNMSYSKRLNVICNVKIGKTSFDPDTVSKKVSDDFVSEDAKKWLGIIDNFTKTFNPVTPILSDEEKHLSDTDSNDALIVEFACEQLTKHAKVSESNVKAVTDKSNFEKGTYKNTAALILLKKLFNTGRYAGFIDAVSIKTQQKRQLDQQLASKIGFTVDEFNSMQSNQIKINEVQSQWGQFTSRRDYVYGVPKNEKLSNEKEIAAWFATNTSETVKILKLTVADVPFTYAPADTIAANKDGATNADRKKLKEALLKLQKEALEEWRKDKVSFKLEAFLKTK